MKLISRVAGVAAATMVAGTLAAVAPANAASGVLTYTCGVPLFGAMTYHDFDVKVDTNLPETMVTGQSAPVGVTAQASVPANLSELAYGFLAARTADGTAALNATINDQLVGPITSTIPRTAVPATGPLPLPVTGTGPAFAPTTPGTYTVKAADFTAAIKFYDEAGTEKIQVEASCTPKTVDDNGTPEDTTDDKPFVQDLTVDTVNVTAAPEPEPVVKADTKTKVKGKYIKKKKMIKAVVRVVGGETKATGKAKVVVKRGKKTVKKLNAKVKNGKAVVKVKKITRKGKYKVVVTYKGDKTHKRSKGKAVVKVK